MATVSEQLREAREKLSLSINDVADATKIRTDHIRALEEGNYKAFAAPVYIRGFVRAYGAMLKLEATQLMADLDAELNREVEVVSLANCVATLAGELASEAGRNRRSMSKDEIDAMWGCEV